MNWGIKIIMELTMSEQLFCNKCMSNGCTAEAGFLVEFGKNIRDAELASVYSNMGDLGNIVTIRNTNYPDCVFVGLSLSNIANKEAIMDTAKNIINRISGIGRNAVALVYSGSFAEVFKVTTLYRRLADEFTINAELDEMVNLIGYMKMLIGEKTPEQLMAEQIMIQLNIDASSSSHAAIEAMIWKSAELLRSNFKQTAYGGVILPFVVMKRFDDLLIPSKKNVLKKVAEVGLDSNIIAEEMHKAVNDGFETDYKFFNTSEYTFRDLARENSDNLEAAFEEYIEGFSDNVQKILENFDFKSKLVKLSDCGILYALVRHYASNGLNFGALTTDQMGMVFENIIRRFQESDGDNLGQHFTAKDIVLTCCDVLLCDNVERIREKKLVTLYDMTMGTSQMLTNMKRHVENSIGVENGLEVDIYGQEIEKETFAISIASALIDNVSVNNFYPGDTLSDDGFKDEVFDFIISNPPFGIKWEVEEDKVKSEHELGERGRFAPGLPPISDGQLLFTLNGIKKLNQYGRMAIIHNASPLFSGNPGSGQSEIRQYIIKNDYLDCIIKLSGDLFYNTGIPTYIWVISKTKAENRKGKVQLIDASKAVVKLRKSIGKKRNEITDEMRAAIHKAYSEFTDAGYSAVEGGDEVVVSKVFDNYFFGSVTDDKGRSKWEIPLDKLFYVMEEKETSTVIAGRIIKLWAQLEGNVTELFRKEA